ncbi:MAG: alpha/beta fold hydrolase [Bdellovibrionota bacterium]
MKRWLRVTCFFAVTVLGAYLGQELLLFPALTQAQRFRFSGKPEPTPLRVERFLVATPDGMDLVAWRLQSDTTSESSQKRVAVLYHSGHDTLTKTFPLQKWLQELGFTSYSFDYRGFGESTGWPSEAGLYTDADAVLKWVTEREQVPPTSLTVVAVGSGAAIAASAAARSQVKTLVLVSPVGSIPERLGALGNNGVAAHLLRYNLPTASFVSELTSTCLISVYPETMDESAHVISDSYRGAVNAERLVSSTRSSPVDLLRKFQPQLQALLRNCSQRSSIEKPAADHPHG